MRRCVFCGGPANSREHAWPEWVIALFRNQEEATIIAERDGEEPREWHGINVSVKVKRFCHGCNTGWMSDLENEARPLLLPMIRGESMTLDGAQRIVVATWCLKTAMVFDLTRTDKNIAILPSERAYLYEARGKRGLGSPFPPHTFIWIASYEGSRFTMSAIVSELRGLGDFSPTNRAQPHRSKRRHALGWGIRVANPNRKASTRSGLSAPEVARRRSDMGTRVRSDMAASRHARLVPTGIGLER